MANSYDEYPRLIRTLKPIGHKFILREPFEVARRLERSSYLVELLETAHREAVSAFGFVPMILKPNAYSHTALRLGIVRRDGWGALRRLDANWWLRAQPEARGNLTINLENF